MAIRHGTIVEINLDSSSARATSLKARIYDVIGKRFILSQTSPPIRPSHVESTIYISYISKEGTTARRLGFSATLSGLSKDYKLSSEVYVPALIVEMKSDPKQISLRKGFRIRPPGGSGISLTIGGRECEIVDISLSGVRFVQGFFLNSIEPANWLECRLTIDGQSYSVEAKIIRVSQISSSTHVAAAFVEVRNDLQTVLSRKILMLERKQLSRGL
jgi:hypothetical protein